MAVRHDQLLSLGLTLKDTVDSFNFGKYTWDYSQELLPR
jgi:hypothetical protein